jgi:cytochrome b subunit of formate dehydrogenase
VEWAKQHHDLWYEEVARRGEAPGRKPATAPPRPASS